MSIFDEVTGRYRAPRLEDLPPPPEPSIWRSAQKGLSDFMDSPLGAMAEIPLTVVTAPQRAVESVIGAVRGGFELSEAEREAYGKSAYDRDAAVKLPDGGESVFETASRRLRGRAYTAPGGGQIARETVAGVGELVGAPSTAMVMGLTRDPSKAGGYRPIAESEQQDFERESPILSRVAAPLRVGTEFAGSFATDPTSLLAFGPKLASAAGGTIAKEAAEAALRSAALETAKAERLASRLFVPGAAVGALGGTLEAGRAISEEGLLSPGAIEATLGAGLATGMGALAARGATRRLDSLPPPPPLELRSYGFDRATPEPARPAEVPAPEPPAGGVTAPVRPNQPTSLVDLPPPPVDAGPERYARPETVEEPLSPTFLDNATPDERAAYTNDVLETARRAYGDGGDGLSAYDREGGGYDLVYRKGGKVTAAARVTPDGVASDLAGVDRVGSGQIARELGRRQAQFSSDALSPDSVKLLQKRKASPEVREAVAQADTADIAQVAGLPMADAAKGQADVAADSHFEFSPEALAVKKALKRIGDVDVPATMERRKASRGPLPKDERGQQVYPGEESLSPDEREALNGVVAARVRELEMANKSQPTGRRPILGGPDLNDVQGYMGTPSHKAGTALEGIPEGPKEIAAAIERDKGNALELRVRDAILRNDLELGEHLAETRAASDEGDASFDFGENARPVDLRSDPTEPVAQRRLSVVSDPSSLPSQEPLSRLARLDGPIKGPSGAEIVGYEWRNRVEDVAGSRGDVSARRVSDWERKDVSSGTGRDIVHVFYVRHPNGAVTVEGVNSAQKILGISVASLKAVAKTQQARATRMRQVARDVLREVDARAAPTASEADAIFLRNNRSGLVPRTDDQILSGVDLLTDGRRFIRAAGYKSDVLQDVGWSKLGSATDASWPDPTEPLSERKLSVRPAPGQRGLEGITDDVARPEAKRQAPEQAALFRGAEMLQPTEARVTEGREADGPIFQRPEAVPEQRKLSTEDAQPTRPAAVSVDNVRRAFPTGKITENEGAWDVRLPGNRNIRVTPTGDVEFSLGDLQKGHPDAAGPEGLKPGMRVVGSWQRIGRGGLISLAKEAGQGTLDHETFHAAMDLVLSEREKRAVLKRFGSEEKAADAYGAWTPADKSNAVFAKLAAFFRRIYRSLFPDAESVFWKVRSGEAFDRPGTPFEEKPLPPVRTEAQPPAPPTPPRTAETAAAAPEPPVSGRRVLPGETPRVEHRVDDLAAATADAGIPEVPLARDIVQSWGSLDPKVKDVLRTYDEQKFYDVMARRNLDAVETLAFDAVIRGKSERLEKLKLQERTPETDAEIAAETLGYIAAQRAYINDGTGLARALAARARVMSAARPAEAFSRRLVAFKVTPQMAGEVLSAIRRDPSLLDLIRSEARALRLSVAEGDGPVKFSAQAEAKLSDRLKGLGLSDEQSNAFVKALREDAEFLPELEAAVKNEAAEPTDVLLKKVFREIKGISDEQAAEILTAFKENPDNLAPLLQSALSTGKIRKALEWWRAGLLSSFSTDAANVSGNIAEHHIRLAETGVSGVLDWMLQKVYGGDRARFVGEVGAEMAGANMAFGPALKNLARNLKDVSTLKDKPLDLSRKLEGQFGAIGGTTGKVVRAIGFGRMGAEDVFFKEWGGGAEAMKLAYRKAANALPAGSSKAEIKARAKQIVDEMADPENTDHADITAAVEKAKENRTFQERRVGSLTDAISGVVRRNPMLSFVAPFVNTPGNIANAIIRRSPLGVVAAKRAYNEFKKAQADFTAGKIDQAAFSAARGKLADAVAAPLLGSAMLAGFTLYANAGGMTGSGPTDERAKNALKESGWSPYSFVLTDPTSGKKVYVPFNRFEPVSSMLGFAADMAEAKNIRNLSLFDKALGSVVENLTSKSYLTGLSEAASLITKPKEFAPQYIKGFVGSWVPNIVGRTAAAIDPIQRDTRASKSGFAGLPEAISKNIQSRIPFASMVLPARASSTGAPVERPGNAFTRFASPAQPTVEKPERYLEREYGRLGWAPTAPARNVTVKGIQTNLTDDEFGVMVKASRRASDEARNLIRSAHYRSLPDDQRELLLDRIYSKWKARGRQSIRAKLERRVAREARA